MTSERFAAIASAVLLAVGCTSNDAAPAATGGSSSTGGAAAGAHSGANGGSTATGGGEGGESGNAGASGTAGSAGGGAPQGGAGAGGGSFAGTGGVAGSAALPTHCADGLPSSPNCTQGTLSVGSIVAASGFDADDGATVTAAFADDHDVVTAASSVTAGDVGFDFLFASTGCNLGSNPAAGGALYVDVDGNGVCDPATDYVFAWGATGGPQGTCRTVALKPDTACTLAYPSDSLALKAAQAICPAIGDCFSFCAQQGAGGTSAICSSASGGQGGGAGVGGAGGSSG